MKRILLFICTLLCANMLLAQSKFTIGNLTYKITKESQVEVNYCEYLADSVTVPEQVTFEEKIYNVTSIGREAFYKLKYLTSVKLPEGIVSINDYAFYKCKNLRFINIPNSVNKIGNSAFENCSNLSTITIPKNISFIGDYAFYNCKQLTINGIPNTTEIIGDFAFKGTNINNIVNDSNKDKLLSENIYINNVENDNSKVGNSNKDKLLNKNIYINNENKFLTGTNLPLAWIMPKHKSVFGAGFLSFLLPGMGELYATDYDKGWGYIAWTCVAYPTIMIVSDLTMNNKDALHFQIGLTVLHFVLGITSMINAVELAKQVNIQNGYLSFGLNENISLGVKPNVSYDNMIMPSGNSLGVINTGIGISLSF